jgi:hypothetical protein
MRFSKEFLTLVRLCPSDLRSDLDSQDFKYYQSQDSFFDDSRAREKVSFVGDSCSRTIVDRTVSTDRATMQEHEDLVDSSSFDQNYSSSTSTISIILNDRVSYQRSVFVIFHSSF